MSFDGAISCSRQAGPAAFSNAQEINLLGIDKIDLKIRVLEFIEKFAAHADSLDLTKPEAIQTQKHGRRKNLQSVIENLLKEYPETDTIRQIFRQGAASSGLQKLYLKHLGNKKCAEEIFIEFWPALNKAINKYSRTENLMKKPHRVGGLLRGHNTPAKQTSSDPVMRTVDELMDFIINKLLLNEADKPKKKRKALKYKSADDFADRKLRILERELKRNKRFSALFESAHPAAREIEGLRETARGLFSSYYNARANVPGAAGDFHKNLTALKKMLMNSTYISKHIKDAMSPVMPTVTIKAQGRNASENGGSLLDFRSRAFRPRTEMRQHRGKGEDLLFIPEAESKMPEPGKFPGKTYGAGVDVKQMPRAKLPVEIKPAKWRRVIFQKITIKY